VVGAGDAIGNGLDKLWNSTIGGIGRFTTVVIIGWITGSDRPDPITRTDPNPDPSAGAGDGKKTNKEITEQASKLGYKTRIPPQKSPINSHGQPVYTDGKNYLSPDVDGHNITNGWKMFNRRGKRTGTYDWDLKTRLKD
jgi:hypothetical protein